MLFGRLFGWLFFSLAILMASAEAVMALGTGSYDGINAGELWVLLSGATPQAGFSALLAHLPAWTVLGSLGLSLIVVCRPKRRYGTYKNPLMK